MGLKEDLIAEGYQKTPYGYVKGVKSIDSATGSAVIDLRRARVNPDTMERDEDDVERLDLPSLQQDKAALEKRLQQVNGRITIYNQTMAAP